MSLREDALRGTVSPIFTACAAREGVSPEFLMQGVARGTIAIPYNKNRQLDRPMAVGQGLSTKVNANIGSSKDHQGVEPELQKLCIALKAGADAMMDLSMGGDLNEVRREILRHCPVPLGTVPIYQAVADAVERRGLGIGAISKEEIFATIRQQA